MTPQELAADTIHHVTLVLALQEVTPEATHAARFFRAADVGGLRDGMAAVERNGAPQWLLVGLHRASRDLDGADRALDAGDLDVARLRARRAGLEAAKVLVRLWSHADTPQVQVIPQ